MTGLPPAQQCTLPECDRAAIDASRPGALCEHHVSGLSGQSESDEPESIAANEKSREPDPRWYDCLRETLEFYHAELDATIDDHTEDGTHPDRPTTAREYFREHRGWIDETINTKLLGWAPPDTRVVDHLTEAGYTREDILATGLFTEDLRPLWQGRYVLPYFDADGIPVYAISRATGRKGGGKAGYDGHPADFMSGKYAKPAHTKDYAVVDEPIYGLETVELGTPVLITEGIADAITAHQAGYPCLSPVTTRFKKRDRDALLQVVDDHDVPRVYLVQDSERPQSEPRETGDVDVISEALTINQYGEGLRGAVHTGIMLAEHDVDARIAELPRPGLDKVDLDDYLRGWTEDLSSVLAGSVPAADHPANVVEETGGGTFELDRDRIETADGTGSALFDLTIPDVTELSSGFRGKNPLGHHGKSGNYFVVIDDEIAHDHKYKATYNPLTYLLCEAGIRRESSPSGSISPDEWLDLWVHAKREGLLPEDDKIPYAALLSVAREHDLCADEDVPSDRDESLPKHVYNAALRTIENEYDLGPGREFVESGTKPDPTGLEVTLDPAVAWRAARAVGPEDVDKDLQLETTRDREAWRCPATGVRVGVVRAVALAEGIIDQGEALLRDPEYDAAYRLARDEYDAPLPEYVTAETATNRWAIIQGALEQLTHQHLRGYRSEVTVDDPDDKDVLAEIDPAWADSESGRRVIALESGGFYCRKHKQTLDPLRFVALEARIIDDCAAELAGEDFKAAYHTAREEYGVPLPEWTVGDPSHVPVLPPASELVGTYATDIDSLDAAREKVERLYTGLAETTESPHVLNALPALGKTTSVVKHADEHPALYIGPRKELQQEVAQKASSRGVEYMHLPVFAEQQVNNAALQQALAIVREEEKDVLKDREGLVERLDEPVFVDDDESETDVSLKRASCPTANGEHGESWALVFQVARELGHMPREIPTRGAALFGEEPPTDEETDPYSQAWEKATDPDAPIDLLIGGHGHDHVGGARTFYSKEDDRVQLDPRVVAIDEFPGLDPYETVFGERYLDHASWLVRCLRNDVDDRQGLFDAELGTDEEVRAWLQGAGDTVPAFSRAISALECMEELLDVIQIVERLQENHAESVRSLGLENTLSALATQHPQWGAEQTREVYDDLRSVIDRTDGDTPGERVVLNEIENEIFPALAAFFRVAEQFDSGVSAGAVSEAVSGDLRHMCETAGEMFAARRDGVRGVLQATQKALEGGEDGTRALALHARDGYAHPDAYLLLRAVIADDEETETVHTESYTFGGEVETNIDRVSVGRATVLVDRNQKGAAIHDPPEFVANDGSDNPVIGLDATANAELWSQVLGQSVEIEDIHDTAAERQEFLQDVLNLQVVQTAPHVNTYSGSTASKNFDADVALVREVAEQYQGASHSLRRDTLTQTTAPGVITTKKVRGELEKRLEDDVSAIDHYGNVTGSNALDKCNLGVVLDARHYGDAHVEKWAAYAGEEVHRTGHGVDLSYGSDIADAVLSHMREDETMQAILRFGRDEEGAIVFAHTAALRDDLPVVGEGAVVQAYSSSAKAVAEAASEFRSREFTSADVADAVDCSRRTVRRALARFVDLGYLDRTETGEGVANDYRVRDDPGAGDVELPELETPGGGNLDNSTLYQYYTWSVRVDSEKSGGNDYSGHPRPTLPAPEEATADPPPG